MVLHDKDIREPLFEFLEDYYGKVRIIEEKNMGDSRADVVMILEDSIVGVEIKSDADNYARLAGQVKDYDQYFDMNIVAVGSTHGNHISKHVPQHWGIITIEFVDDKIDFFYLRQPTSNQNVKWNKKLELMWRPELAKIQELFSMPKYKDKSKSFVITKITEKIGKAIPDEELKKIVSNLLFERDYNNVVEMLAEYRKGELQKKLDKENDPQKQIELMMEMSAKRSRFNGKRTRLRRRKK